MSIVTELSFFQVGEEGKKTGIWCMFEIESQDCFRYIHTP